MKRMLEMLISLMILVGKVCIHVGASTNRALSNAHKISDFGHPREMGY